MTNKKQTDLESAMKALEALVVRMESGELSLEESLTAFEQGIALSRQCQQALENAEQRVRILMEKSATAPLAVFEKTATHDEPSSDSSDFDDKLPF